MPNIYEIDLITEICCEFCNEIIYSHFHCPVCDDMYAEISIYGDPCDYEETIFYCEECGARFQKIEKEDPYCFKCLLID